MAEKDYLETFLKLSGYTKDDIMGFSNERRTFSTTNGGKYRLAGKRIIKLSGPDWPKLTDAEEADEE